MAGKNDKDPKNLNVEADFFGEDAEWLDDPSEESGKPKTGPGGLQVAPPAPAFIPDRNIRRPPPMPTLPPTPSMLAALDEPRPARPVATLPPQPSAPSAPAAPAPAAPDPVVLLDLPIARPAPPPPIVAVNLLERADGDHLPDALPTELAGATLAPYDPDLTEPAARLPLSPAAFKGTPRPPFMRDEVDILGPDLPTQEDATLDVELESDSREVRAGVAPMDASEVSDETSNTGDVYDDNLDEQGNVPLVRTHEPPPARASAIPVPTMAPRKATDSGPAFTPPLGAQSQLPRPPEVPLGLRPPDVQRQMLSITPAPAQLREGRRPVSPAIPPEAAMAPPTGTASQVFAALDDEPAPLAPVPVPMGSTAAAVSATADLDGFVRALVAEASEREAGPRGALLTAAARLRARAGDRVGADSLLDDAALAGDDPALHEELFASAVEHERWSEAGLHLVAIARSREGVEAAEAWERAAVLYRTRLGKPDDAVGFLHQGLEQDKGAYALWCQYRDVLAELGRDEERIGALSHITELSRGRIAADAAWEQGRILQRLKRLPEAQRAFERAREADVAHAPAFLALEALFEQTGDDASLAALYDAEAARADHLADRSTFALRAARKHAAARQRDKAEASFALAVKSGSRLAHTERQAWLKREGRLEDLAKALGDELAVLTQPQDRAHAAFRLAMLKERLGDAEAAIALLRDAVKHDAAAVTGPVGAALDRLWFSTGPWPEISALLEGCLAAAGEDAARATLARIGALAERRGDWTAAAGAWRRLLLRGDATALDALERVARKSNDASLLGEVLARRAEATTDPRDLAGYLVQASQPGAYAPNALELLGRARSVAPDAAHVASAWLAAAALDPHEADVLDNAPGILHPAAAARLVGLRCDRGEADSALSVVTEALEVGTTSGVALDLVDRLAARSAGHPAILEALRARAERAPAAERAWRHLFAWEYSAVVPDADAKMHLLAILSDEPGHPGALARLGPPSDTLANAAWRKAAEQSQRGAAQTEIQVRLADALIERGDAGAARAMIESIALTADSPVRVLARTAEALTAYELAATCLSLSSAPEDRLHEARLATQRLQDPKRAMAIVEPLLASPMSLGAAIVGVAAAVKLADAPRTALFHQRLADASDSPAVAFAHATWAAIVLESLAAPEAVDAWRKALGHRPASRTAFEGVRKGLIRSGDADGLAALYATRPADRTGLANALDEAGVHGAVAAWNTVIDAHLSPEQDLLALLHVERACERHGDWAGAFDALGRRLKVTKDASSRSAIDARRRWLLAEKLAATDQAWDLYRQLHEEQPQDREITATLARIAAARGQTALSVQYLKQLADTATDPVEACRTQRGIALVYEQSGDVPSARQAYLDALDHVSDDAEALAGLRRLAEGTSDWQALVAVLQREEGLAQQARRIEIRREIARLTQDKMKDAAVAMDRWRAVLELAPRDQESLERLVDLAANLGEWSQFVESGQVLSSMLQGADRTALLRRVGIACQELSRDDAARFFEAAISEDAPDLESARRLAELYLARADWNGGARTLALLTRLSTDPAERLAYLERSAKIEVDGRRDRPAAMKLYDKVLEIDPSNETALKFQSDYLFSGEFKGAALSVFERLEPYMIRTQDTDDFDERLELSSYYFRFAELLRETGRTDDARTRYARALELNPGHLPTLEAVGPMYVKAGDWKAAERTYQQILQLTGGQGDKERVAQTFADLGLVEWHLGHPEKAQKRFAKALDAVPTHVPALKGLAMALEQKKDWPNLLHAYNNIINNGGAADVIMGYIAKGRVLDDQMNRPDKAAQHYEGALAIDANQPDALARLAELALRRGAWSDALVFAQRGLKTAPDVTPLRGTLLLAQALSRHQLNDGNGAALSLTESREADAAIGATDLADAAATAQHIRDRLRP